MIHLKANLVVNIVEWIAILQSNLYKASNRAENIAVLCLIMTVLLDQDLEVLEPSIHRLVATLRPPLLGILLFTTPSQDISRHFGDCWVSTVAIVCFYSLSVVKSSLQTFTEDCDVVEFAGRKRAIYPHNLAGPDAESNFVSKGRLLFELVGREDRPLLPDVAVGAIDTHVGVMRRLELPVFKDDLEKR